MGRKTAYTSSIVAVLMNVGTLTSTIRSASPVEVTLASVSAGRPSFLGGSGMATVATPGPATRNATASEARTAEAGFGDLADFETGYTLGNINGPRRATVENR